MRRTGLFLVLLLLSLLCGCDRGSRTDVVLFCDAFNRTAPTMRIAEQDVCRRSDTELLVTVNDVLLRLITDDTSAILSVTATAEAGNTAQLREAAETAFSVMAEPFGEQVPQMPDDLLQSAEPTVQQIETKQFYYLIYADREGVTLQQRSCSFPLPSQRLLRR